MGKNGGVMKKLTKEKKILMRQRAGWEFDLRIRQFMDKFSSKEEPTVKLTTREKIAILAEIVSKSIPHIK